MALNATMYRFNINLSDLNRSYYDDFAVSVALHPSETIERMAIRLVAYCLHYSSELQFTKGLSTDNEPDIWEKTYSGDILTWIELGLPDSKRLKKACSLSEKAIVYAYGSQALDQWWQQTHAERTRLGNLTIMRLDSDAISRFSELIERGMSLSCMIQDDVVNLSWDDQMLEIPFQELTEENK